MLTTKQQKFKEKWERQRVNKMKYCFIHGSIYWGMFVAITVTIGEYFWEKETFHQALITFIFQSIFLMIGGYFMGMFNYNTLEINYQNMLKAEKEDEIEDPVIGDEWKIEKDK